MQVPSTCTLDKLFVMFVDREGADPCEGCNEDRAKCNGRGAGPPKYEAWPKHVCEVCGREEKVYNGISRCPECNGFLLWRYS